MTTVSQLINLAMKDIGVLAAGETASAEDASDALKTLNQLLGQWQVLKSSVPGQQTVSFSATGAQSYTIGPGATVNAALPAAIDAAFYRLNGVDYPVSVLNSFEDYESITLKALTGTIPSVIFYERSAPTGLVYVWPQPSTGTINLVTRETIPALALGDAINLPGEFELAIRYSLAELLLTNFGMQQRQDITAWAARARRVMKRANLNLPTLGQPSAVLNNGRFSIYTGQ